MRNDVSPVINERRLDLISMKIQCVKRKKGQEPQWFVCLPTSLARSVEMEKGEEVDWQVSDENHLVLCRNKGSKSVAKQEKKTAQSCLMSFWDFLKLLGV